MIILIISFALLKIITPNFPIVVLHGINDNCQGWMKEWTDKFELESNAYSRCIETGPDLKSVFNGMISQSEIACTQIKLDRNFDNDYNIVAFSQGTLIARQIIQSCDTIGKVRKFISIGGPQMGTGKIPNCNNDLCPIFDYLANYLTYLPYLQNLIAPAGYFRGYKSYKEYIKYNKFLAYLNNESLINEQYKIRFSSLDKLILVKFLNDDMIYPNFSSWFQFYNDNGEVEELEKSRLYKEDLIGLRKLVEGKRVEFIDFKGKHMELRNDEMYKYVIPHLK